MPFHRIAPARAHEQIDAIERSGEVVVSAFLDADLGTYVVFTQRAGSTPPRSYETRVA